MEKINLPNLQTMLTEAIEHARDLAPADIEVLATEAKTEIERLRSLLRQCVAGADVVNLARAGQQFTDIRQGLKVPNIQAGTNIGDGVSLSTAAHPGDPKHTKE